MKKIFKCALTIFVLLYAISFFKINIHAAAYIDRVFYLKQPDNSKVQVKVTGDEYYQHIESPDGYTLCRDPKTGWICYADMNADNSEYVSTGEIYKDTGIQIMNQPLKKKLSKHLKIKDESIFKKRDSVKKHFETNKKAVLSSAGITSSDTGPVIMPASPISGNVTGLTILVNFPNETSKISKQEIADMFNKIGYTGYGNNGSLRDFYYDVSGGKLNYTNSINGFYTAKHPKSYYNDPSISMGVRAVELVTEALKWLDSTGFNFSSLTTDAQKSVLAVNILYAGDPDVGWAQGLWPHQGWISFSADGVQVTKYEISNIGSDLSIDTICHENGHMVCDYPDLYDYDGSTEGCGTFTLMSYSANPKNPTPPDPYCRNVISGWNSITDLNSLPDGTIVTALFNPKAAQQVYRWKGTAPNEYFLIENIRMAGRYANMPDEGLLIWHVDENGDNSDNRKHFMVSIEQADGLLHLENNKNSGGANDLFHSGYKTDFSNTTTPNSKWYSGTTSGLVITNIGPIGDSLNFTKGISTNIAPVVDAGTNSTFTLPAKITLKGTARDDGLPSGSALTASWSLQSGPGTVTFSNSSALETTVTVSAPGIYIFKLTVSDSKLSSSDTVTVTVKPETQTTEFTAYYKFDETTGTTASDSSGNGLGASVNGTASWSAGKNGNALNLDGSSNYVTLPSGISSSLNDFTIATWVRLDTLREWARIFDFGTGTNTYMFLSPLGGGNLRFAITTGSNNGEERIDAPKLPTGVWKHVAVTLSGNTGILYVDGVEAARNGNMTLKPSSLGDTDKNYIGKSQWSDPYFDGLIDDFRVYGRALSADEVKKLWENNTNQYVYGDVTGDGAVDSMDYAAIKKYLLGSADGMTNKDWRITGDVNLDGTIDALDYSVLRRFLLGDIGKLPVQQ